MGNCGSVDNFEDTAAQTNTIWRTHGFDPWNADDNPGYVIGEKELGKGAYGVVKECWKEETKGKKLACKFVEDATRRAATLRNEKEVMEKLHDLYDHDNILKLHDRYYDSKEDKAIFVLELVEGEELFDAIQNSRMGKAYSRELLENTRSFMKQFLEALAYMHSQRVIHRDLKPGNIMVSVEKDNGGKKIFESLKIIDFGGAIILGEQQKFCKEKVGTTMYMSPQVLAQSNYTAKTDIWSAGMVMYALLSGEFLVMSKREIEENGKKQYWGSEAFKNFCEDKEGYGRAADLIQRMLAYKDSDRISAAEALKEPFFTEHLSSQKREKKNGEYTCATPIIGKQ